MTRDLTVDALLFDAAEMDRCLVLSRAHALSRPLSFKKVALRHEPSGTILVKAAQFGFDEVLDPDEETAVLARQIQQVLDDHRSILVHPLLNAVDVVPGLFTRSISFTDDLDEEMVEMLALGLGDKDIASVTGQSLQAVRNRIARLITDHGLSSRTQLAALHTRNGTDVAAH